MLSLVLQRTYSLATVHALDVMTGRFHPFTVEHDSRGIHAIYYDTGATVRPTSEQFTETEDTFYLTHHADAH